MLSGFGSCLGFSRDGRSYCEACRDPEGPTGGVAAGPRINSILRDLRNDVGGLKLLLSGTPICISATNLLALLLDPAGVPGSTRGAKGSTSPYRSGPLSRPVGSVLGPANVTIFGTIGVVSRACVLAECLSFCPLNIDESRDLVDLCSAFTEPAGDRGGSWRRVPGPSRLVERAVAGAGRNASGGCLTVEA